MTLKGNLKSFSLGEIFQSLSLNRHTGTLVVDTGKGDQEITRYIYFAEGEITFLSPSSPKGFKQLVTSIFDEVDPPFEINKVNCSSKTLFAVADGCLKAAELTAASESQ